MKNRYKCLLLILFFVLIDVCSASNVMAEEKNGWVEDGGSWYYYQNGSKVKNKCKEIYYASYGRNCYFCFDSSGIMFADTEETFNGKTYTFDSNGVRSESYVDDDGVLVDPSKSGWILMDEFWYFYRDGKPITGLWTLDYSGGTGKFYFDEYGEMQTGFVYIEMKGRENEFYFDEEVGYMVTNTVREIDGVSYRFYDDGTFEELDDEYVSDDEDGEDTDYEDDDYDSDDSDNDNSYNNKEDGDGTSDVVTSGGTSSGGGTGGGSSGSSGGSHTSSTYVYSSKVKKTSCESLNNAIDFLMAIVDIIHILAPIILILMGAIDFTKSVASSDEKRMQMASISFIKRCLCAVIIFFIPLIVDLLFSMPGVSEIDIGGVGCEITTIFVR